MRSQWESVFLKCTTNGEVHSHVSAVKQVFSDLDFLGWYSTGELQPEADIKVHEQVTEFFYIQYFSVWS